MQQNNKTSIPTSTASPQTDILDSSTQLSNGPKELRKAWYLPIVFTGACLIVFIFWQVKWLVPSININFTYASPYCDSGVCYPAANSWMKLSIAISLIAILALVVILISYLFINLKKHKLNLRVFYKLIIIFCIISVAVILTGIVAASKSGCVQNNSNDPSDSSTIFYLHCAIPNQTPN